MSLKRLASSLGAVVGAAVVCLLACTPEPPPRFSFVVRVESDPQVPLAGVRLLRDGTSLGESNAEGVLAVTLAGSTGETLSLEVACPEGLRAPEKPLTVVLRPLSPGSSKPEYRVACKPELRSMVVSVRADNGADLPVRYLGREVARTDANGAAHVVLKAAPGENLTLELDTSAQRTLSPQNPRFSVVVPDHDEMALFDQPFVKPAPPKAKHAPRPAGPIPIRSR